MFCGKCGKEIAENVRFCPYCGGENSNAVQQGSRGVRKIPTQTFSTNQSMLNLILMVCGALHILLFFTLSYAQLVGLNSILRTGASYLGMEIPEKLTALNAIRIMESATQIVGGGTDAQTAYLLTLGAFGLPLVLGIALLINLFSKKNSIISIVLSVLTLTCYRAATGLLIAFKEMGYQQGGGVILALLISVIQIAVAILILVKRRKMGK